MNFEQSKLKKSMRLDLSMEGKIRTCTNFKADLTT